MAASAAKRWTPSELSVLEARQAEKVDPKLIAEELGRTVKSVINRVQRPNKRRSDTRGREMLRDTRAQHVVTAGDDMQYVVPPPYVRRERDIRLSIPSTSVTQCVFKDPVEGYSALANRARKISVQDALEICALYTGLPGSASELSRTYEVSPIVIRRILDGSFFERLIPRFQQTRRADD